MNIFTGIYSIKIFDTVALDASHKKEAIAHFPAIFGVFFGIPPNFWASRRKNNESDKSARANMFVRSLTMCSEGFRCLSVPVDVTKISGVNWLVLFVHDCRISVPGCLLSLR
jgi:hypothetical protein